MFQDPLSKPTRITYESHGIKTEVSFDTSDLTVGDIALAFHTVMVGSGFNVPCLVQCIGEQIAEDESSGD